MAEALAALGVAASIIEVVNFAVEITKRLKEFSTDMATAPKAFENVRTRVPLMVDILQKIRTQIETGMISEESQETMLPVIRSCYSQFEELNKMLDKVTLLPNSSTYMKGKKALSSVMREPDMERMDLSLRTNFEILVQCATYQAVTATSAERRSYSISSLPNLSLTTSPPPYALYDTQRRQSAPQRGAEILQTPPIFMMPYLRDSKFLGRRNEVDDIERKFQSQRHVALAGLGGVGKSQIAIEYCYVFHEKFPEAHVFWVYAGRRSRFEQGYEEIARRLELPGWDDARVDTLQLVCSWLSNEYNGSWLLIIDNADDAAIFYGDKSIDKSQIQEKEKPLAHYLPKSPNGSILVTTRDKRVGERLSGREKPVEVFPLSTNDAKQLLFSRLPNHEAEDRSSDIDAIKLVEELAYLPLAITQAAAFISENSLEIYEYLELLDGGDTGELQELLSEDLEDDRRDMETENSVIRTWKLSFDQLVKGKPRAAEILSLMAVLDYQAAPKMLLRDGGETEIGFRTALGTLQAFSLISPGKAANAAYKMHRLVAISTHRWLEVQGTLSFWQKQALNKLTGSYPDKQTYENWETLDLLTPHAQLVFSFTFDTAVELLQCAKLLDFCALYDLGKGRYKEAHRKATRSMDIRKSVLPTGHQLTLDSMQTLGESQLHMGELSAARATLEEAIAGREKQIGSLHPDTLESVSDLTITLLELDDVAGAERTALRALEGRKQVLGERHPDTLVSLNILSVRSLR